jgi:hypothetical protein
MSANDDLFLGALDKQDFVAHRAVVTVCDLTHKIATIGSISLAF